MAWSTTLRINTVIAKGIILSLRSSRLWVNGLLTSLKDKAVAVIEPFYCAGEQIMSELSEKIQRAIKEKSVIRFDYEGDACTVAPFSLGNIKQTLVLLAAPFEGESNIDERMNISGYTVSKMSGLEVTEDKFDVSKNLVPEIYLCGSIFDSTLCRVDTGKTMGKKA